MTLLWFETENSFRYEIASCFDDQPLSSWGLSSRTLNALLRFNHKMTIADIIRFQEEAKQIPGLGFTSLKELDAKVADLVYGTEHQGSIPSSSKTVVTILPKVLENICIDQLHVEVRAYQALINVGIQTVGELWDVSRSSLEKIFKFYSDALVDINDAVIKFSSSINDDTIDWFDYYRLRQIEVLPLGSNEETRLKALISQLPVVLERIIKCDWDNERAWFIIKRRYGLGEEKLTLEDLGLAFNLSRERIRQIEEKILDKLYSLIVDQHYAGKNYHLHPTLHMLIENVDEFLKKQKYGITLEKHLVEYIESKFGSMGEAYLSSIVFLLSLAKTQYITFDYPDAEPVWGYIEKEQRHKIERALKHSPFA